LKGIEKDVVDVSGSISGYSYKRNRDGWSMDCTDQRVLINTELRLLLETLLKLLTQLPEWIKVPKAEIESQWIYFGVSIVSIEIPATRALLIEWRSVEEFVNSAF